MLRRINPALPGLLLGIAAYGLLLEAVGVWFAPHKMQYTAGLFMGILLAMGMAVNMAVVILDTVDAMAQGRRYAKAVLYAVLRYLVLVLAFAAVWYFKLGSLAAMFAGVMGLKVAAYLQPLTQRYIHAIHARLLRGQ